MLNVTAGRIPIFRGTFQVPFGIYASRMPSRGSAFRYRARYDRVIHFAVRLTNTKAVNKCLQRNFSLLYLGFYCQRFMLKQCGLMRYVTETPGLVHFFFAYDSSPRDFIFTALI